MVGKVNGWNLVGMAATGAYALQLARSAVNPWYSPSDPQTKAVAEKALKDQPAQSSAGMIVNAAAALGGLVGLSTLVSDVASSVLERSRGALWALTLYGAYRVYRECQQTAHPDGNQVTVHVHINHLPTQGKEVATVE